jgi:hypothetical protein
MTPRPNNPPKEEGTYLMCFKGGAAPELIKVKYGKVVETDANLYTKEYYGFYIDHQPPIELSEGVILHSPSIQGYSNWGALFSDKIETEKE